MNPLLNVTVAQIRQDELHRAAARRRTSAPVRRRPRTARPILPAGAELRIRYGREDDAAALARLAALDSAVAPAAPVLVAEVDGELWAAHSLVTQQIVADPFRPTAQLVALLAMRAAQLRAAQEPGAAVGRLLRRARTALR